MNSAFEKGVEGPDYGHDYDSITSAFSTGSRRKANGLYESTTPIPSPSLPPRHPKHKKANEAISHRSSRSSTSLSKGSSHKKGGLCVNKLAVFFMLVTFVVSAAALSFVVLMILGIYGPKCECVQVEESVKPPQTAHSGSDKMQTLQRRIEYLEKTTEAMRAEINENLNARSDDFDSLQNRLSFQERLLNETAQKADLERPTSEPNTVIAEIELMNKSINALKTSDSELKTTVNKLKKNYVLMKGMTDLLLANLTSLQTQAQRLRNSSSDLNSRTRTLQLGYAHMTSVMKSLEHVNDLQNMSFESLQYDYSRLESVLRSVNATLSAAADFSTCEHRMIEGTPVSPGSSACAVASYKEPQGKRVMGITCSTDHALDHKLDVSPKKGFYLCKCSGLSERATKLTPKPKTVKCFLNLWECQINA